MSIHSKRKHMYIHIKTYRHPHLKHSKRVTFTNIHKAWKSTVSCTVLLPSAQLLTLAARPLLWPVLSDGISVLCTHSPQAKALLQRTSARRVHKGGGGREGCLQSAPGDTGPGQMGGWGEVELEHNPKTQQGSHLLHARNFFTFCKMCKTWITFPGGKT